MGTLSEDQRRRGSERVRTIRDSLGPAGGGRKIVDAAERVPAACVETVETSGVDAGVDAGVDGVVVKYEMELAAHRETTQWLLDEKDRTIAAQQQLIEALQERLYGADLA